MRLRLFDRIRRLARSRRRPDPAPAEGSVQGRHRRARPAPPASPAPARGRPPAPSERPGPGVSPGELAHTAPPRPHAPPRPGSAGPAVRVGAARARMREVPQDAPVSETTVSAPDAAAVRARWHHADVAEAQAAPPRAGELARVAGGIPLQTARQAGTAAHAELPFTEPHPRDRPPTGDGRRHCGSIEAILWRQWDPASPPPRELVAAVDRLAELPERIKKRLADGLDMIYVGPGGVPELDDMTSLHGVPLPAGRATWDACAGAYGERKIVVGSRPSPTPDVMCHEVGHALDDLDSPPGTWQSDSAEFRMLYEQCRPHFASDFHRQPGGLGRKEFFADAFAAIASRQRPALVDMLSGDTRTALRVMLYFNRRYGI